MDFFSKADDARAQTSTASATAFADAINQRSFNFQLQAPTSTFTRRQPPPPLTTASEFAPLTPKSLASLISSNASTTLIIDIRPHNHWVQRRVRNAVSLSVPSTLLRRPAFSLDKLASMIPTPLDRKLFLRWSSASDIVVYDSETCGLVEGNNILGLLKKFQAAGYGGRLGYLHGGIRGVSLEDQVGLIDDEVKDAKSIEEGQEVAGPSAFLSARELPSMAFQQGSTTGARQRHDHTQSDIGTVKTPHLSKLSYAGGDSFGDPDPTGSQQPVHAYIVTTQESLKTSAANPFYDNIRQHIELSAGSTEGIPLYLPKRLVRRKDELPFDWLRDIVKWGGGLSPYELKNLLARENLLTESGRGGAQIGSLGNESNRAGDSRRRLRHAAGEEGMEALAMQFYRIELGEQTRLMGVMAHHTVESTYPILQSSDVPLHDLTGQPLNTNVMEHVTPKTDGTTSDGKVRFATSTNQRSAAELAAASTAFGSSIVVESSAPHVLQPDGEVATMNTKELQGQDHSTYFPFSITAGIEKGAKNRYRNIWPFDHARVRLQTAGTDDGSDYVNASYIQPRGTKRRYIATQGPMSSTFVDFWTLCWEQNVRIIVMLTKRVENNLAKCGTYWSSGNYGPLRLELVKEEGAVGADGGAGDEDAPAGGFDFGAHLRDQERKARKARRAKKAMERELGPGDGSRSRASGSDGPSTEDDEESSDDEDAIIRRTFLLSNSERPREPPRTIIQLQYAGWPDVNIPESPKNLLRLVWEVDGLVREYDATGAVSENMRAAGVDKSVDRTRAGNEPRELEWTAEVNGTRHPKHQAASPVLVHCSAGVGRTGSFVMIDAILDALRREMSNSKTKVDLGGPVKEKPRPSGESDVLNSSSGLSSNNSVVSQIFDTASMFSRGTSMTSLSLDGQRAKSFATSEGPTKVRSSIVSPDRPAHSQTSTRSEGADRMVLDLELPVTGPRPAGGDIGVGNVFGLANRSNVSVASIGSTSSLGPRLGSLTMDVSESVPPSPPPESREDLWLQSSGHNVNIMPPPFLPASSTVLGAPVDQEPFFPSTLSTQNLAAGTTGAEDYGLRFTPGTSFYNLDMRSSHASTRYGESEVPDTVSESASLSPADKRLPSSSREAFDYMTPRRIHIPKHSRPGHPHAYPGSKEPLSTVIESVRMQTPIRAPKSKLSPPLLQEDSDDSGDSTPSPLSSMDEPVRQVLEGMREQRMSMCQSLRQYVFVHRAIVEGAVALMDEQKQRADRAAGMDVDFLPPYLARKKHVSVKPADSPSPMDISPRFSQSKPLSPLDAGSEAPAGSFDIQNQTKPPPSTPPQLPPASAFQLKPPPVRFTSLHVQSGLSSTSPSKGGNKRLASPTELLRVDLHGSNSVTKRPSLKRINKSRDSAQDEIGDE